MQFKLVKKVLKQDNYSSARRAASLQFDSAQYEVGLYKWTVLYVGMSDVSCRGYSSFLSEPKSKCYFVSWHSLRREGCVASVRHIRVFTVLHNGVDV